MKTWSFGILLLLILLQLTGCATGEEKKPVDQKALKQREREVSLALEKRVSKELTLIQDPPLARYCQGVLKQLMKASPVMQGDAPKVVFFRDEGGRPGFAVAPEHLYLSLSVLKKVQYESELAAWLAMELFRLRKAWTQERVDRLIGAQKQDSALGGLPLQGDRGVFSYSLAQQEETISQVIGILYRAGYDPRGLVMFWELFEKDQSLSHYSQKELDEFLNLTRREIVKYPPLRNPIVRTDGFIKAHQRAVRL